MNTLYFENIIKLESLADLFTVSIPFDKGELFGPRHFPYHGCTPLAMQCQTLSTWQDGSVDSGQLCIPAGGIVTGEIHWGEA